MRRFPRAIAAVATALVCATAATLPSAAAPLRTGATRAPMSPPPSVHYVVPAATDTSIAPYTGLGAWADVYDWSWIYGRARFGPADVDAMAKSGVQTLFIQTSKYGSAGNVLEPGRLKAMIRRAHSKGMDVVGWYLPAFVDEKRDFFKLNAMLALGVDGITVDIESTANKNVASRNAKLVRLLHRLNTAIDRSGQDIAVGAAIYPPFVLDRSVRMWPNFPWERMAPYVHVWLPMSYWSSFLHGRSGMGNATALTADTITRLRAHLGAQARIHVIGGSGMDATQVARMINQMRSVASPPIGGSLYDWRTTSFSSRQMMQPLTQLRAFQPNPPAATSVASAANVTVAGGPGTTAKVTWWAADGTSTGSVDAGGVLTGAPSIAVADDGGAGFLVAAQVSRIPNRDDWRTTTAAYIRSDGTSATGTWRELVGAPAGCSPAVARIPGQRYLIVCASSSGAVQFAYLRDGLSTLSHWFTLQGVPAISAATPISAASAGSVAAISWVDADAHVNLATWSIGKVAADSTVISGPRSGPMLSATGIARLNSVSPNALTITFTGSAGVYRVPVSLDSAVTPAQPDAPDLPGQRSDVPVSVEFGDAGFSFAAVSAGAVQLLAR